MPRKGSKQWPHPAETLLNAHISYTVKFLGECAVDQPKGIDVIRDAIRKMKFSKHIKRAEGQKPPKVDLVLSADAVSILDPKTKLILYQYPLHLISYCADDKCDKQMFTFIAKEVSGQRHFCYVFDSDKCAEEITLTIGQAFDLAFKRFTETSALNADIRKQFFVLQRKVQSLEYENEVLRKRIADLEKMKDRSYVDVQKSPSSQMTELHAFTIYSHDSSRREDNNTSDLSDCQYSIDSTLAGRRHETADICHAKQNTFAQHRQGGQTTGSPAHTMTAPILSPPPSSSRSNRSSGSRTASSGSSNPVTPNSLSSPVFLSPTVSAQSSDIDSFGMEVFSPVLVSSTQEFNDIQAGFNRGLSLGTADFSLEDLDPLNQK